MKGTLGYPIWQKALVELYNNKFHNITELSYSLKATYSHIHKVLVEFENQGYIILEKNGREMTFTFTEEGLEKAKLCNKLMTGVIRK